MHDKGKQSGGLSLRSEAALRQGNRFNEIVYLELACLTFFPISLDRSSSARAFDFWL